MKDSTQVIEAFYALNSSEQAKVLAGLKKEIPTMLETMSISGVPAAVQRTFFEKNGRFIPCSALEAILANVKDFTDLSEDIKLQFARKVGLTVLRRRVGSYGNQSFVAVPLPYYMKSVLDELSNVAGVIENANNSLGQLRSNKDAVNDLLKESIFTSTPDGLNAQITHPLRQYRSELSSVLFFARMSPVQIQKHIADFQRTQGSDAPDGNAEIPTSGRERRRQRRRKIPQSILKQFDEAGKDVS